MNDRFQVGDLECRFKKSSGRWEVPVPIPGARRRKWISTGATTEADARRVIEESGIERLVLLARADALSAEALSIVTCGRRVTCREIMDGWEREVAGKWSDTSLQTYKARLTVFFNQADAWNSTLASISRDKVNRFVNYGDLKQSTRNVRLAAVRAIYSYARAHNYVLQNLADTVFIRVRDMRMEQLERRTVFPLTEDEFRTIVGSPKTSDFWRAATSIGYWAGLRLGDVVSLEWASVTPDFLIVWTKKRGRRVALPFDDPLIGGGELRIVFASIPRKDPVYVFPDQRQAVRTSRHPTAFGSLLARLGISQKSFHSTRHAAISRFARSGKSLSEIGQLVAHSSEAVTKGYIHV